MPKPGGTLKAREFLFYTEDQMLAQLPSTLPRPNRRVMWTILQLYYGDPAVHFELQPQVARGQVELGLHFEADADTNELRAGLLAEHTIPVLGTLGPGWELEAWTVSWRRLHRVFPFERLTADLGREVAGEFARLLETLHPMIDGLEAIRPAAEPAAPAPAAGRSHRRRFRRSQRPGAQKA